MQTLELGPTVADAAARVLESMCFTSILGEAVEPEGQNTSWVAAKLAFAGNPSGNFGIGVSQVSAQSMATSFLGLDTEELSQTQINEVIGELANMIAGSLLSSFESDCCFALSHPEIESLDNFIKQLQSANGRVFQLEGGLLAVWLQIAS